LHEIDVNIISNPYQLLKDLLGEKKNELVFQPYKKEEEYVFLPLYSMRGGTKHVPVASGLNQWNAHGRARNENELYIPIPSYIHQKYPKFFPKREATFKLKLPNGVVLSAKVCQAGSKALMSNPNSDLGEWLLRHVMQVPEGELLTIETLNRLGLDSVIVYKKDDDDFSIDFAETGSYEQFLGGMIEEEY